MNFRSCCQAVVLGLVVPALPGCGASAPTCVGLSPQHVTQDGVASAGPLTDGEAAEDVLLLNTTPVEGVIGSAFAVEWIVEPDGDPAECPVTVDCGPASIEVGEDLACRVVAEGGVPACTWRGLVSVTVTQYDDAVCSDTIQQHRVEVIYEP